MQFVVMGLVYYSFGVYLKPLAEALEVDRFSVSLTLSIESIVVALTAPYFGRLFAEKSLRKMLFFGATALGSGFILMSQINSVWQMYIAYGCIIAVGLVCLTALPSNMLLTNWFDRRRGTALGISQFGISISAAVLVPAMTWLIIEYGWRTAFAVCGVGSFVILVPLIWKFAIKAPEEMGLHPDGEAPGQLLEQPIQDLWTFRRAVKNRDIWLITLIMGTCNMGIASVLLSLPSHMTDMGISALQASSIVAVTAVFGASAKIIFGALTDIFPKRLVIATAIIFQTTGVAMLMWAGSYQGFLIVAVLFGLGYGGMATLWPIMLVARFGRASFPTVLGSSMPLTTPFTIVAVPLTNWIYETMNSYLPAFKLLFVVYLVAVVSLILLRLSPDSEDA